MIENYTINVFVKASKLISNGGSAIKEYGILYTQTDFIGTDNVRFVYSQIDENNLLKDSIENYIAPQRLFINFAYNLDPNYNFYYRAFAKNVNNDIAHGLIISIDKADFPLPVSDNESGPIGRTGNEPPIIRD